MYRYSATADTQSIVYFISKQKFRALLKEHDQIMMIMKLREESKKEMLDKMEAHFKQMIKDKASGSDVLQCMRNQ